MHLVTSHEQALAAKLHEEAHQADGDGDAEQRLDLVSRQVLVVPAIKKIMSPLHDLLYKN